MLTSSKYNCITADKCAKIVDFASASPCMLNNNINGIVMEVCARCRYSYITCDNAIMASLQKNIIMYTGSLAKQLVNAVLL